MSLLHYLTFAFEILYPCTKITHTHGSIMLPPRHPRVLARVTRWQSFEAGMIGEICLKKLCPFCHALEISGLLARPNDIPVLNGCVNTID